MKTKTVETRKRDLVVRITNWLDDKDEPAYDVEVYFEGGYNQEHSKSFTIYQYKTAEKCKVLAVKFAQMKIMELL